MTAHGAVISLDNVNWPYDELVCFNLVRGRTPDEVLRLYRADPAQARTMTRRQADEAFGCPPDNGTVLRAGPAGTWSFCLESWLPVGFDPGLLRRLSAGTDVIHYFRNPKGGFFVKHLRDGGILESFELAVPDPLPDEPAPLRLAAAFKERASTRPYGDSGYDELWSVLSALTGVALDDALVNGPLPTMRKS